MTPPKAPTPGQLKAAEDACKGGGTELLRLHSESTEKYYEWLKAERAEKSQQLDHIQRYRYLSIISGEILALASLAVIAYGIHRGSQLTHIAIAISPVAGLAGVFVWGYRPKD